MSVQTANYGHPITFYFPRPLHLMYPSSERARLNFNLAEHMVDKAREDCFITPLLWRTLDQEALFLGERWCVL